MKKIILILGFALSLISCTKDNNYITINGRVEREINGEGIANQSVYLTLGQAHGSGQYGTYTTMIESKLVTTDLNGNFSVSVKSIDRMFVEVFKGMDDNYSTFELKSFNPNDNIILKVNKFIKFKIYVNNINPFDNNDEIGIEFFSGNAQNFRTKIENFGVQNNFTPNDPGQSAIQNSSWKGTNVNSIVYYNVPENAIDYKIVWLKFKNGVISNGFTNNIPFQINLENEYHFNY
jgi:hypothetical protein